MTIGPTAAVAALDRQEAERLRPIWEHRLDWFTRGSRPSTPNAPAPPDMASDSFTASFEAAQTRDGAIVGKCRRAFASMLERPDDHRVETRPSRVTGYRMYALHERPDPEMKWWPVCVLIATETPLPADAEIVGGSVGGTHYILPDHRGLGLGADLTIAAFEYGFKTANSLVFYSQAGLGSRRAAHRIAVTEALAAGCPVPDEVIADYPNLAADYGRECLPTMANPGDTTATCNDDGPSPGT